MPSIDPNELDIPTRHQYVLGAVGPRPIAFASTIDEEGAPNLSPFSFFNFFSSNPPIGVFSPARRGRDNTVKDSFENAKEVPEVVINVVTHSIVHQMNLASCEYEKGVNEFEKAGLTALASEEVRPFRVKESPVQFECKVEDIIETGKEGAAGNLIIVRAVRFHVDEEVMDEQGRIDQEKIDLVGRMGGAYYCRASGDALFTMPKPDPKAPGIGVDRMPRSVRESDVLTGNDLGELGMVSELPDENEVNDHKLTRLGDLFVEYEDRPEELERTLHEKARQVLKESGDARTAWKILLAFNE
jgi:flavin reductase (DIM6/NTAB) family NADH-FMN oxidoreductase RutF